MSAIRLLVLGDDPLDIAVLRSTLAAGEIDCELSIVADRAKFIEAIAVGNFDLILADYELPGFDGMSALALARDRCPDLPFIFISGSDDAELAIAALKQGATDYVLKRGMERLVPSIRRALQERQQQQSDRVSATALQQSEARLHQVAAHLPNGAVFILDRQLRYLLAEGEALQSAGMESSDLVGKTIWEVLNPALANIYATYYRRAFAGQIFTLEHYSHGRHYSSHGTPLYDDRQEIYAVLAISYDITDRVNAEAALRESEAEYRLLFESIDEGFCIIETIFDAEDRCIDYRFDRVNPAFFHMTGLPLDAIGKTARELVPGLEEFWFEVYGRVALTGEATRFENESAPMQRWFEVYAARVGDDRSRRVAVVFNNITERKQAERISQRAAKLDEVRISLTDALLPLVAPREIQATASRILGEYLGANRVAYFEMSDNNYVVEQDYVNGVSSIVGNHPLSAFGDWMANTLRSGRAIISTDAATDTRLSASERAALISRVINASIAIPLVKNGEFVAGLTVHSCTPRQWTEEEIDLAEEVAERTRSAIDRARTEAELKQSNDRFYKAMRAVEGIVFEWNLQTGTVYRSDRLFDLIGVRPEDAPPTQEWWSARVHPEDLARLEAKVPDLVAGSDRYEGEYRVRHEDGRWIDVWERGYIQRDANGQPIGIVGFTTDVSERKRAEIALQQSEALAKTQAEELATIMEIVPAAIWVASDPQCHQMTANQAAYRLMRTEPGSVTTATPADGSNPLPFEQYRHGRQIEPHDLPMQKSIRIRQEVTDEIDFVFADGSVHSMYGMAVPLYDLAGEVRGSIAAFTDITARKQIERERDLLLERERAARQAADRANRIKDEFLAVLSHELRSPLHPILGWVKLLQGGKLNPAKTQQALQTIERNAQLQSELIEDLLDISRIMRGKLSLTIAPVDLTATVRSAVETVRLAAQAKTIELYLTLPPPTALNGERPIVSGDTTRLQQVVWNLLSNAVKFTPAGGCVWVEVSVVARRAQITIRDNGKGIDGEFLPHVFDYFQQEDGSTTRKFGGLGLGLAIVKQIVELHGGVVKAHSDGADLGAKFVVSIPLASERAEIALESLSPTTECDLQGIRILVVDDETDSREFIAFALTQAGAIVTSVSDAAAALDLLTRERFDILLSDIGMPELDGYQLMEQTRALPADGNGRIPAIAVTAYAGDFDRQRALNAGFHHHLAKPIEPARAIETISRLVGSG